jgi:indolepyruvate ferredoxin oxidoreductase beta subunit
MKEVKNILLVGVGGQGTILASKILSRGLVDAGYDVKMSEIHGMAQRGGSVSTQVRYGEKVYSPIIGVGQADILAAFEKMEACRWLEYLKPDGALVVNNYEIPPVPIQIGTADYPEGILDALDKKAKTTALDAVGIAKEIGNPKTMNVVLLGALVKAMGITDIDWEEAIKKTVKERFIDINILAFNKGMEMVK